MKRKKMICVFLTLSLLMLSAFGVSAEEAAGTEEKNAFACPSVNGRLHVFDGRLLDQSDTPVQLRGISTHGLSWYPEYVNQDCISELKDWGANLLRLALYTAESGGYCTDGDQEALKDLIRAGVEYATEADMYVIVDWHILSEGTPLCYEAEAEVFFDEMSAEFADHDNVLYEICNEPNTADWAEIKAYAEDIIPVIRANDPEAVIIVGTPTWSQDVNAAAADPITDWDNIMYTLHFYAATHKEDLRQKMVSAAEAGLPVFVTEYGICDASGSGALDIESADEWINLMNDYGISYAAWNLSNKDESSAILNPDVTKSAGFDYEDLSESGRWVHDMLTGALNGTPPEEATLDVAAEVGEEQAGTVTKDGLSVAVSLRTDWEDGGIHSYLYDVSMTNSTGEALSGWSFEIDFNEEVSLSDSWNGEFTVSGSSVTVTNADYNGSVEAGESVTDIGFIAEGSESLCLVQTE